MATYICASPMLLKQPRDSEPGGLRRATGLGCAGGGITSTSMRPILSVGFSDPARLARVLCNTGAVGACGCALGSSAVTRLSGRLCTASRESPLSTPVGARCCGLARASRVSSECRSSEGPEKTPSGGVEGCVAPRAVCSLAGRTSRRSASERGASRWPGSRGWRCSGRGRRSPAPAAGRGPSCSPLSTRSGEEARRARRREARSCTWPAMTLALGIPPASSR